LRRRRAAARDWRAVATNGLPSRSAARGKSAILGARRRRRAIDSGAAPADTCGRVCGRVVEFAILYPSPTRTRWKLQVLRRLLAALLAGMMLAGTALARPFEGAVAAHKRGDYATALRLFQPLADQGNATAQGNLGVMYDAGQGVPQNYAEAAKWSRKAADQGHANAQFNLGVMYDDGQGVPHNYAEARK